MFYSNFGAWKPRQPLFTKAFLKERTQYSTPTSTPRLQSFGVTTVPEPDTALQYYSRDAWRGKICPWCQNCMSRVNWEGYCCPTPGCGYVQEPRLQIMPAKACYQGLFNASSGHTFPNAKARVLDVVQELPGQIVHEWNITTFKLSEGCTFTHFSSNLPENGRPGGSEAMFEALQRHRVGLSRRVMGGNSLTRHFAVNHGMHYKYHAHHGTTAFRDSPPVIHVVLSQLRWAARHVAGDHVDPINEVLTVAYFEDMKMNYHDDGESTVGNTIVSLSLGYPAVMSFKMKDKIYNLHGLNADNYDPSVSVVRGSKSWHEREELNALWDKLTEKQRKSRLNKIFRAIERDRKPCPVLFEATLKFGDMMVMHGEHFQKIYDHGVTPQGGMRFALTGRHIKLDKFPVEEHWKGEIEIDPRYVYSPDHRHVRELPEPTDEHVAATTLSPMPTERSSPEAPKRGVDMLRDYDELSLSGISTLSSVPSSEHDPSNSQALGSVNETSHLEGTSAPASSYSEAKTDEVDATVQDESLLQQGDMEQSIGSDIGTMAVAEQTSPTNPAGPDHKFQEPDHNTDSNIGDDTPLEPNLAVARELGWCAPGVASLYHGIPSPHVPAQPRAEVHESTEDAGVLLEVKDKGMNAINV